MRNLVVKDMLNMFQKFFFMLCGLCMVEGRSFPLRQISNPHEDPYEALQRNWPALRAGNYPRELNKDYYVPLIDGKPIYIPADRFTQSSSLHIHASQTDISLPLYKKPVDVYPEIFDQEHISEIANTETPTEISSFETNLSKDNYDKHQFATKSGIKKAKYIYSQDDNALDLSNINNSHESNIYSDQHLDMQPQCKVKKSTIKSDFTEESGNNINDQNVCNYNKPQGAFSNKTEKQIERTSTKSSNKSSNPFSNNEVKSAKFEAHKEKSQEINILKDDNEIPTVETEQRSIQNSNDGAELKDLSNIEDLKLLDLQETINKNTSAIVDSAKEMSSLQTVTDDDSNKLDVPNTIGIHDFISVKEVEASLKDDMLNSFNMSFRSWVFNPTAQSRDKFQTCRTPKNESGHCRYVHHCLLPSIVSSLDKFMDYVCIIQRRYIGVCCPKHPVEKVVVKWKENSTAVDGPVNVPEECGINSKTRVVGGLKSDPKEYPWMAALLSEVSGEFFCAGSLINDRYVLTAAHCTFGVPRNKIIARLGEYDFRDNSSTIHQNYKVMKIKRHGQYSRMTLNNDIALLKLAKPVVFNQFVSTICLPEKGENFIGETAILAGWGNMEGNGKTSDVLMEASMKVMSNIECAASHRLIIGPSQICTGSEKENKGACNGDSGGPLMLLNKNHNIWKAIALVSFGRRGCDPSFPTVYTRVTYYLDWIHKHAT